MKRSRWIGLLAALNLLLVMVTAVSALSYTVQWGDTLSGIARRFGTTVNTIAQANGITNINLIYAGQVLEIPEDGATPTPVTPTPVTPTPVTPTPPTPTPATPTPPPTGGTIYVVQPGDTLSRIASRFGTTVSAIAQANGITNINYIYVGQRLLIPGGSATPSPSSFALGGQSVSLESKARMDAAGMSWLKLQIKWTPGDTAVAIAELEHYDSLQAAIDEAHANGYKILLSITGAAAYPQNTINYASYVNFVGDVATLGPDAIEIWNEMNIDFEWPAGQISPAAYVNNMLAPAYQAIKSVNRDILVIGGALAPTGFDNSTNAWADDRYLAGLRAAGAASYMDCVGVHHNAGATSPNVFSGHPGGGHYSWYFRPTLDLYYNTFAGQRPLCLTEIGYLSPEGFDSLPANFGWAADTSAAEQAQWLAEAAQYARSSGRVRLMIVYNVDFIKYDGGDPQAGYAIVRPDGACPACTTLGSVMR